MPEVMKPLNLAPLSLNRRGRHEESRKDAGAVQEHGSELPFESIHTPDLALPDGVAELVERTRRVCEASDKVGADSEEVRRSLAREHLGG